MKKHTFKFTKLERILLCDIMSINRKLCAVDDEIQVALFGEQIRDSKIIAPMKDVMNSINNYLESIGIKHFIPDTRVYRAYEGFHYDTIITILEEYIGKEKANEQ